MEEKRREKKRSNPRKIRKRSKKAKNEEDIGREVKRYNIQRIKKKNPHERRKWRKIKEKKRKEKVPSVVKAFGEKFIASKSIFFAFLYFSL